MPNKLAQFEEAMVPMGLVAAHWLLPLFSMTLPSNTLYRLWDLFLLHGQKVLICAALTMMRGIAADALVDFENVMMVLQHGADNYFDATPFVESTMQFAKQIDTAEFAGWIDEHLASTKVHAELCARCPILASLIAGGSNQPHSWLPVRTVVMLASPFFEKWKAKTALSAVPGTEPYMCALTRNEVVVLLQQLLPGLRNPRFAYVVTRLAAAAACSSVGPTAGLRGINTADGLAQLLNVNLAQFIDLFGSLGLAASPEQRCAVCFRAFDLDEDGTLGPVSAIHSMDEAVQCFSAWPHHVVSRDDIDVNAPGRDTDRSDAIQLHASPCRRWATRPERGGGAGGPGSCGDTDRVRAK